MKSGKNAFHDTLKREKFSSILLPNKLGHYHHYNMELRLRLKLDEAEINTRRIDETQCRKLSDGHKLDLKFLKDSFFTAGGQRNRCESGLLPCDTFHHSPPIRIARNCYRCVSLLFTHRIRDITRTERKKSQMPSSFLRPTFSLLQNGTAEKV